MGLLRLILLASVLVFAPGCDTLKELWSWTEGLVVSDEEGNVITGRKCVEAEDGGKDCTTTLPNGKTITKHYKPGETIPAQ